MEIAVPVGKSNGTEIKLWLYAHLLKGYFVIVAFEKHSIHNTYNRHRVFFPTNVSVKNRDCNVLCSKTYLVLHVYFEHDNGTNTS